MDRTRRLTRERAEIQELEAPYSEGSPIKRAGVCSITSGLLNKQAAAELAISEKTVKFHRCGTL